MKGRVVVGFVGVLKDEKRGGLWLKGGYKLVSHGEVVVIVDEMVIVLL